jgi:spore germination protein YaaH
VQPVTSDGQYFDGYDYREIGRIADKLILMAHNYQLGSLDGFVGTEWQKNAALTPIAEIYKALKAVTDAETGAEDKGKIALAFNLSGVGWEIDDAGRVKSPDPVSPSMETVVSRMRQSDTLRGRSEAYRNPYIIYNTEAGERIFLWYEDDVSIAEKLKLARLFGVTGASVWRIGIIPNYDEWNVWDVFMQ